MGEVSKSRGDQKGNGIRASILENSIVFSTFVSFTFTYESLLLPVHINSLKED